MVIAVLACGWAGLVLAVAARFAPHAARHRALGLRLREAPSVPVARRGIALRVGALLRHLARRPPSAAASTRVGRAVLAGVVAFVLMAPTAPAVGMLVWALPVFCARRDERRRRSELLRHLPEVADLFVLAVGAGLTVPLAVAAVARRAPGPVAVALRRVVDEMGLGRRLAEALEEVPFRVGEEVRPLVAALVASERYGAPLHEGLARLSGELRSDRRRRAEEAARRVPVKLLFPLVFCTLPAFGLLTVAPLLAGALRALRL